MSDFNFEQALAELEKTVGLLENGDIPLSEALENFEKGIKLSKKCSKYLEESKQKILSLTDFESGENND